MLPSGNNKIGFSYLSPEFELKGFNLIFKFNLKFKISDKKGPINGLRSVIVWSLVQINNFDGHVFLRHSSIRVDKR